MAMYKDKKTGAVIIVESKLSGDWELLLEKDVTKNNDNKKDKKTK